MTDDPGAFTSHPRWQRMLIGVAGPMANFVLTLALMLFYYAGSTRFRRQFEDDDVDWVTPDSPAAQAGIQTGRRDYALRQRE